MKAYMIFILITLVCIGLMISLYYIQGAWMVMLGPIAIGVFSTVKWYKLRNIK